MKNIFEIETEEEYLKYKNIVDINEINKDNETALFEVSASGYTRSQWLIKHGINIHHANNYGRNALFDSRGSIAQSIIEAGIDINHRDNKGQTALFHARYKTAKELIKRNCDVNVIDNMGRNALFYTGDLQKTTLLLEHNINKNQIDNSGMNALFFCDCDRAKLLIKSGIDVNVVEKEYQGNVLFRPHFFEDPELIDMLLDEGINIHQISTQNKTLLFYASNPYVEKFIKAGVDVNQIDVYGYNALFYAPLDESKVLLEYGIDVNKKSNNGEDIILYADYKKTKLIISKIKDLSFYTPEKLAELKREEPEIYTNKKIELITQRQLQIKAENEKESIFENISLNVNNQSSDNKNRRL